MDQRWIDYLLEFHATRDYYACHDYLEEWWFEIGRPKNHLLVGFIQVAVGMYQWRRGNDYAATIMFEKAHEKLMEKEDEIETYGIHAKSLMILLNRLLKSVEEKESFYDVNLPILDFELENQVADLAFERNLVWYSESDLKNPALVDKHLFKNKNID